MNNLYPRPCCRCGNIVHTHPTTAVACRNCGADWDSFIGFAGGALMSREEADAIAANNQAKTLKKPKGFPRVHSIKQITK